VLDLFKQNNMFRILLMYRFFSSIGGAMFSMFILFSVHLIYQNSMYTGIAAFLMAAPRIFSFAVGPIVDRSNKVTIMRLTTLLEFFVLTLLAFSPLQEVLGVLFMFSIIFAYNIAALFEMPASRALLPQIVAEDKIMEANSLINIAAMIGGVAIGAALFLTVGEDVDFRFLYGISAVFLALTFVFSLFLSNISVVHNEEELPKTNYLSDLKEGAKFIKDSILLYTILAGVVMSLAMEVAHVNRPMFLEYHIGAQGYVVFSLVSLIGGIGASYFVGKVGSSIKIGKLIFMLFACACAMRIAFALLVPVHYFGGIVTTVAYSALSIAIMLVFSTLNQKIPPNDMVGRVDTISLTFRAIFTTLGALAGGFLGSIIADTGHIFIYQGLSYLAIGVLIILVPSIRTLPTINDVKKSN